MIRKGITNGPIRKSQRICKTTIEQIKKYVKALNILAGVE
jgi:hypothetical protein